jgi:hypothetical protein
MEATLASYSVTNNLHIVLGIGYISMAVIASGVCLLAWCHLHLLSNGGSKQGTTTFSRDWGWNQHKK